MRFARFAALAILTLALLAAPLIVEAQPAAKVFRIGFLATATPTVSGRSAEMREGFVQGLRELGYVEGQNIVIVDRYADGKTERLPALAAELVRLKVDVIVAASGTHAANAAQRATSTIPIVITIAGDPVGTGLVPSLARPGGNITGLSSVAPDLVGKQLQLLKEAVPGISRVAVLSNPNNPLHAVMLKTNAEEAR
jgi:putative ABC transport system substrate-binding protein